MVGIPYLGVRGLEEVEGVHVVRRRRLEGLPVRRVRRGLADEGAVPRAAGASFWRSSALRAHTKLPYKTDLLRETPRALTHPGWARTVERARAHWKIERSLE